MQVIVPLPGPQHLPDRADFAEAVDQKPVGKKCNFGTPFLVFWGAIWRALGRFVAPHVSLWGPEWDLFRFGGRRWEPFGASL